MKRDLAIDYLRSAVTVSVVAHHSALAYNTFSRYDPSNYIRSTAPVVDIVRFGPLDHFVAWNDLFFMALMFFISGLFVGPSISRKGVGNFLTDRSKRLGVPFVVSAIFLSPLAFYPSWNMGDTASQGGFLLRFFTTDGWSPGPAWFIWVLLLYCGLAAGAYHLIPEGMEKFSWSPLSATGIIVPVLGVSLAATIPIYLLGVPVWSHIAGPLTFPTSRGPLYLAWFFIGFALGNADPEKSLSHSHLRWWPLWLVVGALAYLAHAIFQSREYFPAIPPSATKVILAGVFSVCCTFTSLAALGLARSIFRANRFWADHFAGNAYGVYIFHYVFVIWLQYALLAVHLPAAVKFVITFFLALVSSWSVTSLLRKTEMGRFL